MKRILFYCLTILVAASCGKERSEGIEADNVYLKFKVDGQSIEYPDHVFATRTIIDGQYVIVIRGQKNISSHVPALDIFIRDTIDISKQIYTDNGLASGNAVIYSDSASVNYSSLHMVEPSDLRISIANLDSTYISGTFSSKVADLHTNNKAITEGSFSVRFQ